jgi:hypothetical protein
MAPWRRVGPLRSRRANARRAVPRRRLGTSTVQRRARMAEGGIVTRVGELPTTLPFPPARRCARKQRAKRARGGFAPCPPFLMQLASSNQRTAAHAGKRNSVATSLLRKRASSSWGKGRGPVKFANGGNDAASATRASHCTHAVQQRRRGESEARVSATSHADRDAAAAPVMRAPSNAVAAAIEDAGEFHRTRPTPPAQPKAAPPRVRANGDSQREAQPPTANRKPQVDSDKTAGLVSCPQGNLLQSPL